MRENRAGIFEEGEDLDLSGFTKKPTMSEPVVPEIRQVSEKLNFQSREPAKPKQRRYHRTGRNRPLATKIDEVSETRLYRIYDNYKDTEKWTIGEIIGLALEVFERELDKGKAEE